MRTKVHKDPKLVYFKCIDHAVVMTNHSDADQFKANPSYIELTGWLVSEDKTFYHLAWSKVYDEADTYKPGYSGHWQIPKSTVIEKSEIA